MTNAQLWQGVCYQGFKSRNQYQLMIYGIRNQHYRAYHFGIITVYRQNISNVGCTAPILECLYHIGYLKNKYAIHDTYRCCSICKTLNPIFHDS